MKPKVVHQLFDRAKIVPIPAAIADGVVEFLTCIKDQPGYPDEYRLTFLDRAQTLAPQLKPNLLAAGKDPDKLMEWQRKFHLVDPWARRLLGGWWRGRDIGVKVATGEQIEAFVNFLEEHNSKAPVEIDEYGEPFHRHTPEYYRTIERDHRDAWYYLIEIGLDTPKRIHVPDIVATPFERLSDLKERAHRKLDETIAAAWPDLIANGLSRGLEPVVLPRAPRRSEEIQPYDNLARCQILGQSAYEIAGGKFADGDDMRTTRRGLESLAKVLGLTRRPYPESKKSEHARWEKLENGIL